MKYRITEMRTLREQGLSPSGRDPKYWGKRDGYMYIVVEYMYDDGTVFLKNDFIGTPPRTRMVYGPENEQGLRKLADGTYIDYEDRVAVLEATAMALAATMTPEEVEAHPEFIKAYADAFDVEWAYEEVPVDFKAAIEEAIETYGVEAVAAGWSGDHTEGGGAFYKQTQMIRVRGKVTPTRDDTDPSGIINDISITPLMGKDTLLP